jgi:NAD-dependent deacetylase
LNYKNIVILTGAGISAESGIKTFRDHNGLWENYRVEEVASPEGFNNNPELVHRFYNLRRRQLISDEVKPNPAHEAIANFTNDFKGQLTIITQNVDNLHERAGSIDVLHMHGELLKMFCLRCQSRFQILFDLSKDDACQSCKATGSLRPDIVWFGEMPYHMDKINRALKHCDLFISIGTSGHVYPAAGFVSLAKSHGAKTVELNLEHSQVMGRFHVRHYGPASVVVPKFLSELIQSN